MSRAYTDSNVSDLGVRLTDSPETRETTQETQAAKSGKGARYFGTVGYRDGKFEREKKK